MWKRLSRTSRGLVSFFLLERQLSSGTSTPLENQVHLAQFPIEHMASGPRMCVLSHFSRVQLFATLWTVVFQAPLSMGFSMQEYWSGLPLPTPGDLPNLGIEPASPALQADSLPTEPPGKPPTPGPLYCFQVPRDPLCLQGLGFLQLTPLMNGVSFKMRCCPFFGFHGDKSLFREPWET